MAEPAADAPALTYPRDRHIRPDHPDHPYRCVGGPIASHHTDRSRDVRGSCASRLATYPEECHGPDRNDDWYAVRLSARRRDRGRTDLLDTRDRPAGPPGHSAT